MPGLRTMWTLFKDGERKFHKNCSLKILKGFCSTDMFCFLNFFHIAILLNWWMLILNVVKVCSKLQ